MRRRSGVRVRGVIFVGVEGKSDRAFVQFLQRVCDGQQLHLHLDVKQGTGGDSLQVVDEARRRLERYPVRRRLKARLVLLDADRIEQDRNAGRDAIAAAAKWELEVVLLTPNLEGLLLRLHRGHQARAIPSDEALRQLRKLWNGYDKGSLSATDLSKRFELADLRRAARYDRYLARLLELIGF